MVTNIKILIELFTYLYCLAELFGEKLKISIHAVVFVIWDLFMLAGINDYGFPQYLQSLLYLGMFLYGILCYRKSIKITFINCFLAAVIVSLLQLLMFLPSYYLLFINYKHSEINEMLIMVGCFLTIVLCGKKLCLKKLSDFFIQRNKLIIGVFGLVLLGLGINLYRMWKESTIFGTAYVQMIYFILIILFSLYEWQKSKTDAEKRKTQLEMNKLYYDAYDQLIMLIRERQHDIKSHINAVLGMAYTTSNYNELIEKQREYCGYVMEKNEKTKLALSIENPLIAGFLYSKLQEAESKNIKVDYKIGIKKADIIVPEYELVEILSILIDNAMEALCSIDETAINSKQIKKIYLTMEEFDDYVELIVANTSNYYGDDITEQFFNADYSSKGNNRGIGLTKLKKMMQNEKGDIIVSNKTYDNENYLVFTIRIPK